MKKKKTNTIGFILAGLIGAFTATLCCITPVILVSLGFGTVFAMLVMHKFHAASIVSGIIIMTLLSLYLIKRQTGVCNINSIRHQWTSLLAVVLIMIAGFYTINTLIVEPVAALVYGNLDVQQRPLGNLEELAKSHGMPPVTNINSTPEREGTKEIVLELEGLYCGSCGPAIIHDIKSINGVKNVTNIGKHLSVMYNSDITNKNIIIATIHYPYTAKLVEEYQVEP